MSSFLRDALRNKANAASASDKLSIPGKGRWSRSVGSSTATSFISVGRTLASALSSSGKQKKRRRAPISKLGCPEFFARDPPPAAIPEGVDLLPAAGHPAFTTGHAKSLKDRHGKPWLSLVLWSHASASTSSASYCDGEDVQGEVRLRLDRGEYFGEISVWLVASVHVRGTPGPVICQLQAPIWPATGRRSPFFSRQKLKGTFVWPFTFPLPADSMVYSELSEANTGKGHARVRLPPNFLYKVAGFGVDISYSVYVEAGRDRVTLPFRFLPRTRPVPQLPTPFPFLPTRDEWPFSREVINGWSITPFGGRGRFGTDPVEVEGLIGIQHPAVFAPGDVLTFKLLLISSDYTFLDALSFPSSVRVEFVRAVILGPGSLDASYGLHDRHVQSLATGMIWKEGKPPGFATAPEAKPVPVDEESDPVDTGSGVLSPEGDGESRASGDELKVVRAPSPAQSLYDEDETHGGGRLLRFDGKVELPSTRLKPSFRYADVSIEYLVVITFSHPDYTHISPRGHFSAEVPVWICSDDSSRYRAGGQRSSRETVVGTAVDVSGQGVSRGEPVTGFPPCKGALMWDASTYYV